MYANGSRTPGLRRLALLAVDLQKREIELTEDGE